MAAALDIPFLGAVVPREVSAIMAMWKEITAADFDAVLKFTLEYLRGAFTEEEEEKRWNKELLALKLCTPSCIPHTHTHSLFFSLSRVISCVVLTFSSQPLRGPGSSSRRSFSFSEAHSGAKCPSLSSKQD